MNEYDITEAFRKIENELIASMIRNMDRHRAEETKEGIEWSMWQAEQLKALERYKFENQKKYKKQFKRINQAIAELISEARERGSMEQEIEILEAIQKGFKATRKISRGMTGEFFKLNERKLEALVRATTDDIKKAETAILRMANDQYRKAIFNAQVYANSGAGTYEKAVDMATKDMLAAGLNCVVYANGARHTLSDYADMAIRTASKRAYLQGEGEKRQEWGIATVIVNKRGNPCPKCLPFCGKVLIDDVWSGGPEDGISPETGKRFPLISKAIEYGLYHPRCKDSHTTYFEGISTADDTWTKEELEKIGQDYQKEQREQYTERQMEKYERLSEFSLDDENQKRYAVRREEWKRKRAEMSGSNDGKADEPINKFGEKIEFDPRIAQSSKDILVRLSNEYNTRLRKVMVGANAKRAAGLVEYTGNMYLSSRKSEVPIHEFAHSLAQTFSDKIGVTDDKDFWKEIKKIQRQYKKDVGDDVTRWISSYEHSSKGSDEFFAEAFAHAKSRKLGIDISEHYGKDYTYSEQVLEVVDKYFKKSVTKSSEFGIMESGARITDLFSNEAEEFAKMYYEEIRSFSTDAKKIANNIGKPEEDIKKIKEYLFETGFDPDCAIAQSWQRLMNGKDIKSHDRTLIEHELLEMRIKRENPEIEHWKAHETATQKYNYQKEAEEYYDNLEKHKKDGR